MPRDPLRDVARRLAAPLRYSGDDLGRLADDGNPHAAEPHDAPPTPPEPPAHEPAGEPVTACPHCGDTSDGHLADTHDGGEGCEACTADCGECGRTFFNDDLEAMPRPGGRRRTQMVCAGCRDDRYTRCEACDSLVHQDDTTCVGRGGNDVVCSDCAGDYTRCEACDDRFPADDMNRTAAGRSVCDRCLRNGYFRCEGCREHFPDDENDGDDHCEGCHEDDPDEIHDYNYSPDALTFHGDDGRHYGVELETAVNKGHDVGEAARQVVANLGDDFCYLKKDSSITHGAGGFEIVTHPATLEVHKQRWPAVLAPNAPPGLVSHDAGCCGLHVHVDREGLSDLHIAKIVAFVNAHPNAPFVQQVARRTSDQWARLDPAKTVVAAAKENRDAKAGRKTSRYVAINLNNDPTIEFRIFKGTLKPESFFRSLEFVDAAVEYMRPGVSAIGDAAALPGFFGFVAANRKRYPFLWPFCERFQGRNVADPPAPKRMAREPGTGGVRLTVRLQFAGPNRPAGDAPMSYARDEAPLLAAVRRLARPPAYHGGTLGVSPTTHWVDAPAPANPAAAVAHPGVVWPRLKLTPGLPTLRPNATVAAPLPLDDSFSDANVRHHRERAAVYEGMLAAGLPAGGGTAPETPGGRLWDYVTTLARAGLASDPAWADRYRTAAARLADDDAGPGYRAAVSSAVRDLLRRHAGDPGLMAHARAVREVTDPRMPAVAAPPADAAEPTDDVGPFPLSQLPADDLPPLPLAKRPPKIGSPLTPAVGRRLGTDPQVVDDVLPLDWTGETPQVRPATDLPPLPLAPTPRGSKRGTPFDPKARRQFVADRLAAQHTDDQIAEAFAREYGVSPREAALAVRRFKNLVRPPAGRTDPPLALQRLRELVTRYGRRRTKKVCKNKACKKTFLSHGPQHVFCSPRCRTSSQVGYRDGFHRGKKRAAVAVEVSQAAGGEAPTQMGRATGKLRGLLRRHARGEDTLGRQAAARLAGLPGLPGGVRNQIDREAMTPPVATPAIERDLSALPDATARREYVNRRLGGDANPGIIPFVWATVGGRKARVSAYDPRVAGTVKTNLVGRTLEQWVRAGGGGGEPLPPLGPKHHAMAKVARALAQGLDEPQYQLAKGLDRSGVEWYERDLHRLDAGLITLYGDRTPEGGYRGRFGEVNRRGQVVHRTPHLKLFKVLLGGLSPNMNPVGNLDLALHLYETARQARPGANPLAALPPHKGVRRDTGEYDPRWAYRPNPKLSPEDAAAAGLTPHVNAAGRVQGNTLYLAPKVAVAGYDTTRRVLAKLLHDYRGDEGRAADFFLTPMPLSELEKFKPPAALHDALPRPDDAGKGWGYGNRDGEEYHGAWLLGPKAGPFVLNTNYHNGMITKDLWFSRSWNRLMGTLTSGPRHKLQDVPRGPEERRAMDEAVGRMADALGLTPSELQAVWWYYEQGLYRAMAARAESNSFADGINRHLAGRVPLTAGLTDPQKAGLPDPKLKSAEDARRAEAVKAAQAVAHRLARGGRPGDAPPPDARGDQFPRPPREVFEDLRAEADRLRAAGRMPAADEFLAALAAEAERRGVTPDGGVEE